MDYDNTTSEVLDRLDVMHLITGMAMQSAAHHISEYANGYGDAAEMWNEMNDCGHLHPDDRLFLKSVESAAEAHADKSDALIWFVDTFRKTVTA